MTNTGVGYSWEQRWSKTYCDGYCTTLDIVRPLNCRLNQFICFWCLMCGGAAHVCSFANQRLLSCDFLNCFFTLIFEAGSLRESGTQQLTRPAGPQAPGILLSLPLSSGATECTAMLGFSVVWALGCQTQATVLAMQALSWTEPSPQPWIAHF